MSTAISIDSWQFDLEATDVDDRSAANQLSRDVEARLTQAVNDVSAAVQGCKDDAPLFLIRRLEIDLHCDVENGASDIARQLADALAEGIAKVCATRRGAVIFDNHAQHAAAYITSRMQGNAGQDWWFDAFDGLTHLPESSMVRTLLSRDWSTALLILTACSKATRETLFLRLDDADVLTILHGIAAEELVVHPGKEGEVSSEVWAVIASALMQRIMRGFAPSTAVLAAVCDLGQRTEVLYSVCLLAHASALIDWCHQLGIGGSTAGRHAISAITNAAGTQRSRVIGLPPTLLKALAEAESAKVEPQPQSSFRIESSLLGYVLLLPVLDRLLPNQLSDWPSAETGIDAEVCVRLAILSAAAGTTTLAGDQAWLRLFGVDRQVDEDWLDEWSERISAKQWAGLTEAKLTSSELIGAAAMSEFAQCLPGFSQAGTLFLRANIMGAGGVLIIDYDGSLSIELKRPPLDILLGMTCLADRELALFGGQSLALRRAQ
ncbi:hypothetical protein [Erythrobacter ani]|uniref:HDOD domain-containing protein n=1 Tax=Erythrobacter ani TaxID=2827235 RepID=A0ABS6SMM4_9SPHN|nr:hypothetical protein [Erythrobacter ani]MBV7266235.1 hypothetical protein [Erythrobacter ani]